MNVKILAGLDFASVLNESNGQTQSGNDMFRTAASAIPADLWVKAIPEDGEHTSLAVLIGSLKDSRSDDEYTQKVKELQKLIAGDLYGFALCWEEYFFPFRTDEFEGQSFLPRTGEVNYMLFYRIKKK